LAVKALSLAGWSVWGLSLGIFCDKSSTLSLKFLASCAATVSAILVGTQPPASFLAMICMPFFFIGSRIRVVGLTGGIASGKSSVSHRFRQLGFPVVDADAIAHSILEKGTPSYHQVIRAFREYDIVDAAGNINRAELRKLVFGNRELNKKLKQCTHTSIAFEMLRQICVQSVLKGQPVVILDAPLLFESKANILCKEVICVYCEENVQISRLSKRDSVTVEECKKAISSQMPVAKKKQMSDICIDNGGSLEQLERQVDEIGKILMKKSLAHPLRMFHTTSALR